MSLIINFHRLQNELLLLRPMLLMDNKLVLVVTGSTKERKCWIWVNLGAVKYDAGNLVALNRLIIITFGITRPWIK